LLGLRAVLLILGLHEQVALENIALHHQISILRRDVRLPRLLDPDRLFWVVLARIWKDWRRAIVVLQPETVIDWQRRRFKQYGLLQDHQFGGERVLVSVPLAAERHCVTRVTPKG
jgi:hypothetical protein